jgi:hypothetical protein
MDINMDFVLLGFNTAILLAVLFALFKFKSIIASLSDQSVSNEIALEAIEGLATSIEESKLEIIKNRNLAQSLYKISSGEIVKDMKIASKANTEYLAKHNQKLIQATLTSLSTKIATLSGDTKTGLFGIKAVNQSNLERISELVQSLRIQNISELINELASHQELKIETEDSIKHLGECKITRIEDKQTGQDTQIFYENGNKSLSETYQGSSLKYRMEYNPTGLFVKGTEFDSDENPIFEYEYDEAGEVVCKHKYVYEQGVQPKKITTQYSEKEAACI